MSTKIDINRIYREELKRYSKKSVNKFDLGPPHGYVDDEERIALMRIKNSGRSLRYKTINIDYGIPKSVVDSLYKKHLISYSKEVTTGERMIDFWR